MRSFRKERIASVVRDVVSDAIAHRVSDPRVEPLTTVTRVEMTADLLVAKIYLTIPGGPPREKRTLAALRHASGFLQRRLAGQLSLRNCPELRFDVDEAVKIATRTLTLIERNRRDGPPPDESGVHETNDTQYGDDPPDGVNPRGDDDPSACSQGEVNRTALRRGPADAVDDSDRTQRPEGCTTFEVDE